ncbi:MULTISPECIES: hypothetical protein [Streptomyces]|uniref:hypothetical protein n=1 Tax=Streptomyces TaxID=1883 RepID=UPI00163C1F03|nr:MULTISPECIES: hypothetical protein [Streptomyces]MBC2876118.1 hypothetical protein [Streptomyces sp. TYQ1024]UBI38476.1 hypothetical protein K7I03_19765 [Streptomyces mobaraensis]UKW31061.1 hypothetical protein MCU78_19720 [Streptomyces sp. TYQ1024]
MVVTIRVVIVAITVCTVFLLSWIPMLRMAIVRRRAFDWALFWVVLVASVVWLFMMREELAKTVWYTLGVTGAIGTGVAATAYYLWSDIRHHRAARTRWAAPQAGVAPAAAFPAAAPGPYAPVHPGGQPIGGHLPPLSYSQYGPTPPVVGQHPYGHLTGGHSSGGHSSLPPSAVPPGGAMMPGHPMGAVPGPAGQAGPVGSAGSAGSPGVGGHAGLAGPVNPVDPMAPGASGAGAGAERPYRPRHARPAAAQEATSHPAGGAPFMTSRQPSPPLAGQAPAYGYPQPDPHAQTTVPSHPRHPADQGHRPAPHQSPAHPQAPAQPSRQPSAPADGARRPQRIDQVRAELDELSDLLRRGPGHQGEREQ